ncbi:MAG: hypothetical protein HRT87_01560 [Legionellales bacterium]|nr:hypothetical protein [Legionellales bacterium]
MNDSSKITQNINISCEVTSEKCKNYPFYLLAQIKNIILKRNKSSN